MKLLISQSSFHPQNSYFKIQRFLDKLIIQIYIIFIKARELKKIKELVSFP